MGVEAVAITSPVVDENLAGVRDLSEPTAAGPVSVMRM